MSSEPVALDLLDSAADAAFPLPVVHGDIPEAILECGYHQKGLCRSCTLLEMPQDQQLAGKYRRARAAIDAQTWLEPAASRRESFRNKVKLVVTGTAARPNLGILGPGGKGQDLANCPLPTPGIREAIPVLRRFISACRLEPYNAASDSGTLKNVLVTESPDGELMVRFVARRRGVQGVLFKRNDELLRALPNLRVITLNVQPEHKAILEGNEEIVITEAETIDMRMWVGTDAGGESVGTDESPIELTLRPKSFFQTNTDMAEILYRRAVEWVGDAEHVWDLYSGVGGFALALATHGSARRVVGVEESESAVEAARAATAKVHAPQVEFVVADARTWVRSADDVPNVVVVNPPRRGIETDLAQWLNESAVERVFYSSCNIDTLARDLAHMPNFRVELAQVVDMFPHTEHFETVALLTRVK